MLEENKKANLDNESVLIKVETEIDDFFYNIKTTAQEKNLEIQNNTDEEIDIVEEKDEKDAEKEIIALDTLKESSFIGSKPDTIISNKIGETYNKLQVADFSPLNNSILNSEQRMLLEKLGFTSLFNENTESIFQSLGLNFFDSFINSLRFSSALNYSALRDSDSNRYDNVSFLDNSNTNNFNASPSLPTIFGDNNNNPIIGTNASEVIYGNLTSASAPYSAEAVFATSQTNDFFGRSVIANNNLVLIGAAGDGLGTANSPSVYLYNIATDTLRYKLTTPSPDSFTKFTYGSSSIINDDYILVNAPWEESSSGVRRAGAVYLYDTATGNLLHNLKNRDPNSQDEYFGDSIAMDDTYIVVGIKNDPSGGTQRGSIDVYDIATGTLQYSRGAPVNVNVLNFGDNLILDNGQLFVAAPNDIVSGQQGGSIFVYDVATNTFLYKVENPTPASQDKFGIDMLVNNSYLIVGDSYDDFGAMNAGTVRIFDRTDGSLVRNIFNPTPNINAYFGSNIKISGDNLFITSSRDSSEVLNEGALYVYDIPTGNLLGKLQNPTPQENDYFGLLHSSNNNYIAVSAYLSDNSLVDDGAIYIYDINTLELVHTILDPTPEANGQFGQDFDMTNNYLIVGDGRNDTNASNSGAVIVFQIDFSDSDVIRGGGGDDILYGLNGDDILFGEAGADTLHGGNGADRFVFENTSAFTEQDIIADFDATQGDVIDISDIITGYTRGVSDINDFARFIDTGADSILEIDADGIANGVNFQAVTLVTNGAGLDALTLETSGQLDGTI